MNTQVHLFAKAILNEDLSMLETLLHEKFTFDTKSKWQTLEYFKEQFKKENNTRIKDR